MTTRDPKRRNPVHEAALHRKTSGGYPMDDHPMRLYEDPTDIVEDGLYRISLIMEVNAVDEDEARDKVCNTCRRVDAVHFEIEDVEELA